MSNSAAEAVRPVEPAAVAENLAAPPAADLPVVELPEAG